MHVPVLSSYQSDNGKQIATAVRTDRIDCVFARVPHDVPCVEIFFKGGHQSVVIPCHSTEDAVYLVEVIESSMRKLFAEEQD
jgi:hypothetical protein